MPTLVPTPAPPQGPCEVNDVEVDGGGVGVGQGVLVKR